MGTSARTAAIPVTLRVSEQAREKLARQAADSGQDLATVASDPIDQAIARPTIDELLAPYRKQVAESGLSDEELDTFHRDLLATVRSEKEEQR